MKKTAFISYSMNDSELYILSLVIEHLSKNNFYINTSYENNTSVGQNIILQTKEQISQSDLFIGIASHNGIHSKWVMKEWEIAQHNNNTAVFLIEDSVPINPDFIKENFVILFNRQNPEQSLTFLKEMIENQKEKKTNNALNWVVGGLLGIAIIKLLSDE
ncbi:TIR domain-containing protein [Dokdonia ponticola]|uniref:TIR domain-containing protein n=1 Tax=Dokdonia ponticola TaxID=2041041 RepID=A0ABV9HV96_9FLAO